VYHFKPFAELPKVTLIGPKAFDGTGLRASGGYKGASLVAFVSKDTDAGEGLLTELKSPGFRSRLAGWRRNGQLRVARVDCDKHSSLCKMFGVAADPVLAYFVGGEQRGTYEGEPSADAIALWADETFPKA